MFLMLMPVPYVDASGSSAFARKGQRALVAAAGMLTELLLAALALAQGGTVALDPRVTGQPRALNRVFRFDLQLPARRPRRAARRARPRALLPRRRAARPAGLAPAAPAAPEPVDAVSAGATMIRSAPAATGAAFASAPWVARAEARQNGFDRALLHLAGVLRAASPLRRRRLVRFRRMLAHDAALRSETHLLHRRHHRLGRAHCFAGLPPRAVGSASAARARQGRTLRLDSSHCASYEPGELVQHGVLWAARACIDGSMQPFPARLRQSKLLLPHGAPELLAPDLLAAVGANAPQTTLPPPALARV